MSGREVTYPSTSPATFLQAEPHRPQRETEGRGQLYVPERAPAFEARLPAVVLLPGLGGITRSREPRYGEMLASHGYVTLACDTFGERGAGTASLMRRALTISEAMMTADAYAGARWLAAQPGVDPDRIAVLGFSYGGLASVLCAYEQVARLFARDGAPRFAAHAALYGCTVARFTDPTTTGAPVRMVQGDLDRNVDLDHVRAIADDLRRGGSEVELEILEGVYHQWDGPHREVARVRPSPRRLRLEVGPDNRARDPRTGLTASGGFSRALAMLAGMDPRGYEMKRDEAVLARSDAGLLAFLDRTLGEPAMAQAAVERAEAARG